MKKSIRILAAVVAVILFFNGLANNVNVFAASVSSDTKNIEKVLKYYKKGQYKKAQKYNKKLSKIVKEKCVKKMPAKIKKVGERDNANPYFSLRCGLADHALYTGGYRIDYSDLL